MLCSGGVVLLVGWCRFKLVPSSVLALVLVLRPLLPSPSFLLMGWCWRWASPSRSTVVYCIVPTRGRHVVPVGRIRTNDICVRNLSPAIGMFPLCRE